MSETNPAPGADAPARDIVAEADAYMAKDNSALRAQKIIAELSSGEPEGGLLRQDDAAMWDTTGPAAELSSNIAELDRVAVPLSLDVRRPHLTEMQTAAAEAVAGLVLERGGLSSLANATVAAHRYPENLSSDQCMAALVRECGGDQQAQEEVASAKLALARFAARGFSTEYVETSGMGNSPRFIRALATIGRAIKSKEAA